jgi:hypothetical protein
MSTTNQETKMRHVQQIPGDEKAVRRYMAAEVGEEWLCFEGWRFDGSSWCKRFNSMAQPLLTVWQKSMSDGYRWTWTVTRINETTVKGRALFALDAMNCAEEAWAAIQNHDSSPCAARGEVSALVPACYCGKPLPEPVEAFRCSCGWVWKVEEVVSDLGMTGGATGGEVSREKWLEWTAALRREGAALHAERVRRLNAVKS